MGTEAERLSAARGKEEQLLASDALQMPLAPGWEAIDDPGGTYYYNSTTGESTYDRPEAKDRGEAKAAALAEAQQTAQAAAEAKAAANDAASQAKESARRKDEARKQLEACLERSSRAQQAAEAAQAGAEAAVKRVETTRAAAAAAQEQILRVAPLAAGWDEYADANGPYYANATTGESTRERPAAAMVEQPTNPNPNLIPKPHLTLPFM